MATKKKSDVREPEENEQIVRTATHTIIRSEQGALLSCVENESGDEVPLPLEYAYLTN